MLSNSISKSDSILESETMLDHESKVADSTANVINNVETVSVDLKVITIMLVIIVVLLLASTLTKIYKLHTKCIKKKYTSRANNLDIA